jgi:hypothetical protein
VFYAEFRAHTDPDFLTTGRFAWHYRASGRVHWKVRGAVSDASIPMRQRSPTPGIALVFPRRPGTPVLRACSSTDDQLPKRGDGSRSTTGKFWPRLRRGGIEKPRRPGASAPGRLNSCVHGPFRPDRSVANKKGNSRWTSHFDLAPNLISPVHLYGDWRTVLEGSGHFSL